MKTATATASASHLQHPQAPQSIDATPSHITFDVRESRNRLRSFPSGSQIDRDTIGGSRYWVQLDRDVHPVVPSVRETGVGIARGICRSNQGQDAQLALERHHQQGQQLVEQGLHARSRRSAACSRGFRVRATAWCWWIQKSRRRRSTAIKRSDLTQGTRIALNTPDARVICRSHRVRLQTITNDGRICSPSLDTDTQAHQRDPVGLINRLTPRGRRPPVQQPQDTGNRSQEIDEPDSGVLTARAGRSISIEGLRRTIGSISLSPGSRTASPKVITPTGR